MLPELFSCVYRATRSRVIGNVYARQAAEGRPRDLEDVVEIGDARLKKLPRWTYNFKIPEGIGIKLHDLEFPSPLTLAAFKDDLAIIDIWMHLGLGGACIKTVMKEQRDGNPRPRLQEVQVNGYNCLLNAMGLPGHGVEGKIEELKQSSIFSHDRPIGISIGGSSVEEYQHNFLQLHVYLASRFLRSQEDVPPEDGQQPLPFYYEINISCPNTPEGQQMSKHPELLQDLLIEMRRPRTQAVIGVKLSPDMKNDQLLAFAELLKKFPKTYLNLGNTTYRKCPDVGLPQDAISIGGGGLSGPALYQRTLEMTSIVAATRIPIIATGGVDSADKVKELLDNGATAVGIATAVVQDMYCVPIINYELAKRRR